MMGGGTGCAQCPNCQNVIFDSVNFFGKGEGCPPHHPQIRTVFQNRGEGIDPSQIGTVFQNEGGGQLKLIFFFGWGGGRITIYLRPSWQITSYGWFGSENRNVIFYSVHFFWGGGRRVDPPRSPKLEQSSKIRGGS